MKVVDSMWFTSTSGCCGLVVGEDETTKERRLYVGISFGLSQEDDEEAILSWGSVVNIGMLEGLIAKSKIKAK